MTSFLADAEASTWTARDFRFHTGQVLPELRLRFHTLGAANGVPVLVLHGTAGSGGGLLTPEFAGVLFAPSGPFDLRRHRLILPDAIGAGQSSRPSDGLRTAFPAYDYDDMVAAQHRLVTEGLGLSHLRAVIGHSMGGMHAWLWAQRFPALMDAVVPMACLPSAMSGRNWMLRRLLTESIRSDPQWLGGHYTQQPASITRSLAWFATATTGGSQALQRQAPTWQQADALLQARVAEPFSGDANDLLYQWEASAGFDAEPGLGQIDAAVLAINATDDERCPVEFGVMPRVVSRLRNGRYLELPASEHSSGHGTTLQARLYSQALADWLAQVPRRTA